MNFDPVLVHHLFGVLVATVAGVMLLEEIGALDSASTRYVPASACVLIGLLLALDPWLFHGGDFGAEGHQHTALGLLLVAGGIAEAYREASGRQQILLKAVVPAALAATGVGFLWHEQHESYDMLLQTVQHRIMGATLLLAAGVKLSANLRWLDGQWSRAGWLLLLLAFSLQLLLYVEEGDGSVGLADRPSNVVRQWVGSNGAADPGGARPVLVADNEQRGGARSLLTRR